tara:strand:- start:565 stop:678 length:114 start_codon:yes stop_codon:yes gene_type:complete
MVYGEVLLNANEGAYGKNKESSLQAFKLSLSKERKDL